MAPVESLNDSLSVNPETATRAGVTLSVIAGLHEQKLTIAYRVENGRQESIYLVNRIFQWTPSGLSVDAGLVYAEVKEGQLRLSKACLAVPEHLKVESPDVPYLSEVTAGQTFGENVSIALPLRPYHPYDQVRVTDSVHTFDAFQFAVGWFPEGKVAVRSVTLPDGLSLLSADYGPVMREQTLLAVTMPVMVETWIDP
jgi:hypothetical protein